MFERSFELTVRALVDGHDVQFDSSGKDRGKRQNREQRRGVHITQARGARAPLQQQTLAGINQPASSPSGGLSGLQQWRGLTFLCPSSSPVEKCKTKVLSSAFVSAESFVSAEKRIFFQWPESGFIGPIISPNDLPRRLWPRGGGSRA